ncbi:zinc finger bed domain-containing protein 1-like [Gigaspora margarita]|uniref:Zinc finger bed domain-containing protein 1-like n=1 Tax=Gigaspora margarita TaxID=4874 RepID=A0A8H4EIR8_GIGMA|nr:zinc finger bed domain-containing protein 1-like [Gigaspora margarita]
MNQFVKQFYILSLKLSTYKYIATGNCVGWCLLEVIRNRQKQTCNTICNTNRSTGNIWDHLSSIHGIIKDSNLKSKDQSKISIMFKTSATNLKHQTKQNQFLVEWIIDSVQALRVVKSEKFKAFIVNLDSYYELSTSENIYDDLIKIIDNWDILNQVNTITTNNAQNIVKALKLMDVQAKVLIARTKRLLAFFVSSKQSERLENVQKKLLVSEDKNTLKELIIILCPFSKASTYLDASKSSIIGFINPILSHIKQDLYNENFLLYNPPNLKNLDMAFDDEIDKEKMSL